MNPKKTLYFLFSAAGMLVLILDGETALLAAREGTKLCVRSVIPSLFPFMFLSTLLSGALWGSRGTFLQPVRRILNIPDGCESLLIAGFLGGYPVGAQTIGQAHRSGGLDTGSALSMLRFCSNAGPAFLFGFLSSRFPEKRTVAALWIIHILSALLVAITGNTANIKSKPLPKQEISPTAALSRSLKAMGLLCGWILCFRILLTFLDRWFLWRLPVSVRVLCWGLVELSNGCMYLSAVENETARFLLCSVMLSFGGLCVLMQTASVTAGLPLRSYIGGKVLQTVYALILSILFLRFGWISLAMVPVFPFIREIGKKRSSIMDLSGV